MDEQQLSLDPKLVSFKVFNSKDEAKEFIKTWEGEDQLSDPAEGKDGKYFVTLPNVVSKSLAKCYNRAVETVGLNVPLGHAWVVHRNWFGCH